MSDVGLIGLGVKGYPMAGRLALPTRWARALLALAAAACLGASTGEARTVWSSTITTGDASIPSRTYGGWSGVDPDFLTNGSLSPTTFTYGGASYQAVVILDSPGLLDPSNRTGAAVFKGDVKEALRGLVLEVGSDRMTLGTSAPTRTSALGVITLDPDDPDSRLSDESRERLSEGVGIVTIYTWPLSTSWLAGQSLAIRIRENRETSPSVFWNATMVVDVETTPEVHRFGYRSDAFESPVGSISEGGDTFAWEETEYVVLSVLNTTNQGSLALSLGREGGAAPGTLVLEVGSNSLALGGALQATRDLEDGSSIDTFGWPFSAAWRANQTVRLALIVGEAPPPATDSTPTFGGAAIPSQMLRVGQAFVLRLPEATGGDGALTYSLTPDLPRGLAFSARERTIAGTPEAELAPTRFVWRATDSDALGPDSAELVFTMTVRGRFVEEEAEFTAFPAGSNAIGAAWRGGWAEAGGSLTIEARWPDSGTLDSGWVEMGRPDAAAGEFTIEALEEGLPYTLRLRSASDVSEEVSVTTGHALVSCTESADYLCLRGGRFGVRSHWTNPDVVGSLGLGAAVRFGSSDESGLFWFFDEANVELVVKVLDGRRLNDSFWVFFGALSDVEYWVTVDDTASGARRTYHNPPREICGQSDVRAFVELPGSDGAALGGAPAARRGGVDLPGTGELPPVRSISSGREGGGGCEPDAGVLCLLGGRFSVEVDFVDPGDGLEKVGLAYGSETTRNTGFFWFFSEENVELAVKVLDGRDLNGSFWVLYGGLSDVGYVVTVTDTVTGDAASYVNEAGSLCGGLDLDAFPL